MGAGPVESLWLTWPSVPASATVGGRDARLIRGRVDAGAAATLNRPGQRSRRDGAGAAGARAPQRLHVQTLKRTRAPIDAAASSNTSQLGCRGECWNGLVTRPGDERSPNARRRPSEAPQLAPAALRLYCTLRGSAYQNRPDRHGGTRCPGRVRDLPERIHIDAETTVGGWATMTATCRAGRRRSVRSQLLVELALRFGHPGLLGGHVRHPIHARVRGHY